MGSRRPHASAKVTPPAREAFRLYVQEWQDKLGLHDWRIVVSEKLARDANMAEASCDLEARLATIYLGRDFGALAVNDDSLEELALHEVAHVWLHEFKAVLSHESVVPEDVLGSVEHRLVHTIIRLALSKK